jgi:hypothetical protein
METPNQTLMRMIEKDQIGLGNIKLHEEVTKILSNEYTKACVFHSCLTYNFDKNTWFIDSHLGKPNHKREEVNHDMIKNWIVKCKQPVLAFSIGFEEGNSGHANMIVINRDKETIEHFEPHGGLFQDRDVALMFQIQIQILFSKYFDIRDEAPPIMEFKGEGEFMDDSDDDGILLDTESIKERKELIEIIHRKKSNFIKGEYTYYPPDSICPKQDGFQALQEREEIENFVGTCAWWSIFFMDYRLKNIDISPENLFDKALEYAQQNSVTLSGFIYDFIETLINKLDVKIDRKNNVVYVGERRIILKPVPEESDSEENAPEESDSEESDSEESDSEENAPEESDSEENAPEESDSEDNLSDFLPVLEIQDEQIIKNIDDVTVLENQDEQHNDIHNDIINGYDSFDEYFISKTGNTKRRKRSYEQRNVKRKI